MHYSPARKDRDRNSGFLTPLLYLDFLGGIKRLSQMIPPYAMWCVLTTSTRHSFEPGFFSFLFFSCTISRPWMTDTITT